MSSLSHSWPTCASHGGHTRFTHPLHAFSALMSPRPRSTHQVTPEVRWRVFQVRLHGSSTVARATVEADGGSPGLGLYFPQEPTRGHSGTNTPFPVPHAALPGAEQLRLPTPQQFMSREIQRPRDPDEDPHTDLLNPPRSFIQELVTKARSSRSTIS